jgi:glutamate-ammonia-ligase adenylyltransferase
VESLARLLGYPPGASGALLDDWARAARRARRVVRRVVYAEQ